MISLFAQSEQNMNAVERVLHYAELPPEEKDQPPNSAATNWPESGSIVFEDVNLLYREGLPLVLKGINFRIMPEEKVDLMILRNTPYLTSILGWNCWTYWVWKKFSYPGSPSVCAFILLMLTFPI
jgi:hypothetical protein